MQSDLFYCKVTLHVSSAYRTHRQESSGVLKTVTAASGTGYNISTATSLQRGKVRSLELLKTDCNSSDGFQVKYVHNSTNTHPHAFSVLHFEHPIAVFSLNCIHKPNITVLCVLPLLQLHACTATLTRSLGKRQNQIFCTLAMDAPWWWLQLPLPEFLKCETTYITEQPFLHNKKYRVIQNDCQGINNLSYTIHLVLRMQPHVIYFYGVTSRIRFMFLLFPQVSRNWRSYILQTISNELDYHVDVCRITNGAYIEHLYGM